MTFTISGPHREDECERGLVSLNNTTSSCLTRTGILSTLANKLANLGFLYRRTTWFWKSREEDATNKARLARDTILSLPQLWLDGVQAAKARNRKEVFELQAIEEPLKRASSKLSGLMSEGSCIGDIEYLKQAVGNTDAALRFTRRKLEFVWARIRVLSRGKVHTMELCSEGIKRIAEHIEHRALECKELEKEVRKVIK